jgi:hypothetical protein
MADIIKFPSNVKALNGPALARAIKRTLAELVGQHTTETTAAAVLQAIDAFHDEFQPLGTTQDFEAWMSTLRAAQQQLLTRLAALHLFQEGGVTAGSYAN